LSARTHAAAARGGRAAKTSKLAQAVWRCRLPLRRALAARGCPPGTQDHSEQAVTLLTPFARLSSHASAAWRRPNTAPLAGITCDGCITSYVCCRNGGDSARGCVVLPVGRLCAPRHQFRIFTCSCQLRCPSPCAACPSSGTAHVPSELIALGDAVSCVSCIACCMTGGVASSRSLNEMSQPLRLRLHVSELPRWLPPGRAAMLWPPSALAIVLG
jgi:hypothetical protein